MYEHIQCPLPVGQCMGWTHFYCKRQLEQRNMGQFSERTPRSHFNDLSSPSYSPSVSGFVCDFSPIQVTPVIAPARSVGDDGVRRTLVAAFDRAAAQGNTFIFNV
jgi:hypothetical protein